MSLSHILKAASITSEMIDRRDTLKRLYGDRYAERTKDARVIVHGIAKRDGKSILEAALWIARRAVEDGNGGAVNVVIAVAVDLCEVEDATRRH